MPTAEASTPAPTYRVSDSSRRPWMVPSSPNGPWSSGNTTSTVPSSRGTASGDATISWCSPPISASVTVSDDAGTSGSDAADRDHWAVSAAASTHCPDLAMPMGMTSYLSLLMAPSTPAAVTQLTACSLDRPPKSTATRGLARGAEFSAARFWSDIVSNRLQVSGPGTAAGAPVGQRKVCRRGRLQRRR